MTKVFKALSDPTRRRVLELLRERPMTAGELSEHFDVSKPTMSAHFAVLREANLVDAEKSGKTITYRLNLSVLEDALLGFARMFGIEPARTRRSSEAPPQTGVPGARVLRAGVETGEHVRSGSASLAHSVGLPRLRRGAVAALRKRTVS